MINLSIFMRVLSHFCARRLNFVIEVSLKWSELKIEVAGIHKFNIARFALLDATKSEHLFIKRL